MASIETRFWRKVDKRGPDECWPWTASTVGGGYGQIGRGGRGGGNEIAHRLSWMIANGPIPEGLYILHSCDNPICVNPAHLSPGTQKRNLDDMAAKGRANRIGARGERGGLAKLTWPKVEKIRSKYKEGARQVDLAKEFGVSQATISEIVRRKTWI